jgi:hypothetical protein
MTSIQSFSAISSLNTKGATITGDFSYIVSSGLYENRKSIGRFCLNYHGNRDIIMRHNE